MSFSFHKYCVFMLMQAFCSVPWMWVHWSLPFPAPHEKGITESSSQCRQALKCCLLQKFSSVLPVECLTTFLLQVLLGMLLEHRLLAPVHLQTPWIPTDSLCSWSPDWRHSYSSGGQLLWSPLPSFSRTSFHSDFNHSSSLVHSWGAVRIHCNLIFSWDIRSCINYSDSETDIYKT